MKANPRLISSLSHTQNDQNMSFSFSKKVSESSITAHPTTNFNAHDIKSASTVHLQRIRDAIDEELHHRASATPYEIVEVCSDHKHVIVREARLGRDQDDLPRYSVNTHEPTLKLFIGPDSTFHQSPEVGNIFEIYCVRGDTVDVARRVATHC